MWQIAWADLQEHIARWRTRTFPADEPTADQWLDSVRLRIDDLVDFARVHSPYFSSFDTSKLSILVALVVQAPRTETPSNESLVDTLVAKATSEVQNPDPNRCFEIVTAWGCGWGRNIDPCAGPWEKTWPLAMLALRSIVEASVRQTVGMIQKRVNEMDIIGRDDIRLYADMIALELAKSRCACGSHLKSCKQKDDHACCRPAHRLATWKPAERTLRSFVAEAVRGLADDEFRSGAYALSMLYPLLRDDTRLIVGSVEFKVCHVCDEKYEGSVCANPACRAPDDLHRTRHEARKNWLLIPYDMFDGRGHYVLVERWRCSACACLYPLELPHCPLSHGVQLSPGHGSRTTSVWVYSPRRRSASRPVLIEWLDLVAEELEEAPE